MSESQIEYPKPSLTADVVTFSLDDAGKLCVLLIQRGKDPFAGRWAIPGGFCEPTETVLEAGARELLEETGVRGLPIEELGTYSRPGRDPRGWVVSVAHIAVLPASRRGEAKGSDDATAARFFTITQDAPGAVVTLTCGEERASGLAFDHDEILAAALARLDARADVLVPLLAGRSLSPDEARRFLATALGRG